MKYLYVPYNKFNPNKLTFKGKYIGNNKPIRYLCNNYISLDTETSHINETGWMYQWAFSYYIDEENRFLVYGRRPSELIETLVKIIKVNGLNENRRIVIFVHNLSYDYNYIKDWLEEYLGYKGQILALKSHDIISYSIAGLEFRCSYKLSNRSLYDWSNDLNVKHKKLKDYIDYKKVNYQDSLLNKRDWKYMFRDIICLDECIEEENKINDNNIHTMPYTSTGYIRNFTRNKFKEDKKYLNNFNRTQLDYNAYCLISQELAGGYTHGNRFLAEQTLRGCIRHRDFVSHYPSQEVTGKCPVGRFLKASLNYKMEDIIKDDKNCYIMVMLLKDVDLKNIFISMPYIQASKLLGKTYKTIEDNGRILAIKGECILVCNEYDLDIIQRQYKFEYKFLHILKARKGNFPKYIIETAKHFMEQKTIYKEAKNNAEYGSDEYYEAKKNLDLSKKRLNSISGMTLTKSVRDIFYENEKGEWDFLEKTQEQKEKELEEFYKNKKSFVGIEVGAYTTSQGRHELIEIAELIGYNNVIYGDTDSFFYFSTPEIEAKLDKWNEEKRKLADENGWYIINNDKKVYFNQFALEDENITEFRFMHSKCYAYVTDDGKLHTVIAGVNGKGRDEELGTIENLKDGFVFKKCGGSLVKYFNNPTEIKEIDGHFTEIASGAIIEENTKTLRSIYLDKEEIEVYNTL